MAQKDFHLLNIPYEGLHPNSNKLVSEVQSLKLLQASGKGATFLGLRFGPSSKIEFSEEFFCNFYILI
ncbi:MAG TPA: hypothetical protein VJ765_05570, partial [Chitinophagaceae bacterium]|nr:hypothetical protein [Chitinophagaceae bacterium]